MLTYVVTRDLGAKLSDECGALLLTQLTVRCLAQLEQRVVTRKCWHGSMRKQPVDLFAKLSLVEFGLRGVIFQSDTPDEMTRTPRIHGGIAQGP